MRRILLSIVLLASVSLAAYEHGPGKGTLVIVGGNMQDPGHEDATRGHRSIRVIRVIRG